MRYADIVRFNADDALFKRLGFSKALVEGTDIAIASKMPGPQIPSIIRSENPGTIISAIRESNVAGAIFAGFELNKNAIEKIADSDKILFIPASEIIDERTDRNYAAAKARKIAVAAHKLKAKVRIVSLASSKEQLLSRVQLDELSRFITKGNSIIELLKVDEI